MFTTTTLLDRSSSSTTGASFATGCPENSIAGSVLASLIMMENVDGARCVFARIRHFGHIDNSVQRALGHSPFGAEVSTTESSFG